MASEESAHVQHGEAANPVPAWFGTRFGQLHPLLQTLHQHGGTLRGTVQLGMADGWSGRLARWVARRQGWPPEPGSYGFEVVITHQDGYLHWQRCFERQKPLLSLFKPVGNMADGWWEEQTGAFTLRLQVDTDDGGWHWRCLSMRFHGWPLPQWLFPRLQAYKKIEDGRYRFHVGFAWPWGATFLSYAGLLDLAVQTDPPVQTGAPNPGHGIGAQRLIAE